MGRSVDSSNECRENGNLRVAYGIEEISSVPGIGVLFVGPADLSTSLGVSQDDPLVEKYVQRTLKAALAKGIPCGITANKNTLKKRLKQGFKFALMRSTR